MVNGKLFFVAKNNEYGFVKVIFLNETKTKVALDDWKCWENRYMIDFVFIKNI